MGQSGERLASKRRKRAQTLGPVSPILGHTLAHYHEEGADRSLADLDVANHALIDWKDGTVKPSQASCGLRIWDIPILTSISRLILSFTEPSIRLTPRTGV